MARKSEASMYDEPEINEDEYEAEVSTSAFEIDDDVEMGGRARGIRTPKYPFDSLQVGQSFHVATTAAMPKPGVTVAGAVTNANVKWSHPDPSGATETKTLSVFATGEDGKRVKGADGKFEKIGEKHVVVPVMISERHFTIRAATPDDRRGPGARVFRDL